MKRKIYHFNYYMPNTLLLLWKDIEHRGKRYILKKAEGNKTFNIPGKLLDYENDNTINISVNSVDS